MHVCKKKNTASKLNTVHCINGLEERKLVRINYLPGFYCLICLSITDMLNCTVKLFNESENKCSGHPNFI